MGWGQSFLNWVKRPDKRRMGARRGPHGALRSYYRGLRCEPLENRCLLSLGTYALVEGPVTGSDSDIVSVGGAWTAAANAAWLHTTSSGHGSGLATFTFDANTGATRTGTLTVAGATLTVTQAGSSYVAINQVTPLVSAVLKSPQDVAVDRSGNIYIADTNDKAIKEWNATTQTLSTLVLCQSQKLGLA